MSLRTTVLLLPLLTGCGVFCHDPGELAIDVYDHDYAPIDDVQVEVTSDSGEAVALDGDGTSWYASGLKPGDYDMVVTACGGAQVEERVIEVEPTNGCQDKDEATWVTVELDPC